MNLFTFKRSKKKSANFRVAGVLERESVYVVEALEPRILLSAAPMSAPADAPIEVDSTANRDPFGQEQHAALAHAAKQSALHASHSDADLDYFYGFEENLPELTEEKAPGLGSAAEEFPDKIDSRSKSDLGSQALMPENELISSGKDGQSMLSQSALEPDATNVLTSEETPEYLIYNGTTGASANHSPLSQADLDPVFEAAREYTIGKTT